MWPRCAASAGSSYCGAVVHGVRHRVVARAQSTGPGAGSTPGPSAGAAEAAAAERRRQTAAPQSKSLGLSSGLHEYLVGHGVRSTRELDALHRETCTLGGAARMVSPPDTVALLQVLLRLMGAERVVEVGVFTGFTTLGMALARERSPPLPVAPSLSCISTFSMSVGRHECADAQCTRWYCSAKARSRRRVREGREVAAYRVAVLARSRCS